MAKISEISLEELEHFIQRAYDEVAEMRQSQDETDQRYWMIHTNDAREILERLGNRIYKQMGFDYDNYLI